MKPFFNRCSFLLLTSFFFQLSLTAFETTPLPAGGLAEHDFLYAGEWDYRHEMQTLYIIRAGEISWSYQIPLKDENGGIQEFSDAMMLPDGNVLFAYMKGARLVSQDKEILWEYVAPKGYEVHVSQAIGENRVMIIQNGNPAAALLVDTKSGEVEKEIPLPVGNPNFPHGNFRRVRMTEQNTLLAAHMDWNKVAEYDLEGNRVWELAVISPWSAERLESGNTLITSNRGWVREYTPKGDIVWEFNHDDAPQYQLFGHQVALRLENRNTVISYWCPGVLKNPEDWEGSIQILEVTPEKKVVWALSSWENDKDLGPATCIQLLDE